MGKILNDVYVLLEKYVFYCTFCIALLCILYEEFVFSPLGELEENEDFF